MSRVLMLSYNFDGSLVHDRHAFEWKFARSGYDPEDQFLVVLWGKKRETAQLSERLTIESLPAFAGRFRPLYDVFFPFVIVWLRSCRRFAPEVISIADFQLAPAAFSARLFLGGSVQFHLGRLPRDLAKTRSTLHYWFEFLSETLGKHIPDQYIVINKATRQYLLDIKVPAQKIILRAPNTIRADETFIAQADGTKVRERIHVDAQTPIVLSVGRLEPEKGFDDLIRVFAAIPGEPHLVILGEGRLRTSLESLAQELNISARVHLLGQVARSDLWNFFAAANVFVLLSKSEGLGLVVWEAMYANVPVIGSPVGGIKESIGIEGERGFFWSNVDGPEAFAAKIHQCIHRNANLLALIDRAHNYVAEQIGHL